MKANNKFLIILISALMLLMHRPSALAQQEELKPLVIEALGNIGDSKSTDLLLEQIKDKDLFVKIFSIRALRNIKDPELLGRLKAIKERNELAKMYLNALMAKLGDEEAKLKIKGYLNSDVLLIRSSALNLIRLFRINDFLDVVYSSLVDKEPIIRRRAIEA